MMTNNRLYDKQSCRFLSNVVESFEKWKKKISIYFKTFYLLVFIIQRSHITVYEKFIEIVEQKKKITLFALCFKAISIIYI